MGPTYCAFSWDPTIPTIPLHCVLLVVVVVVADTEDRVGSSLDTPVQGSQPKAAAAAVPATTIPETIIPMDGPDCGSLLVVEVEPGAVSQ
jgi:hypothetical protein